MFDEHFHKIGVWLCASRRVRAEHKRKVSDFYRWNPAGSSRCNILLLDILHAFRFYILLDVAVPAACEQNKEKHIWNLLSPSAQRKFDANHLIECIGIVVPLVEQYILASLDDSSITNKSLDW
jgi:hypothetical protein